MIAPLGVETRLLWSKYTRTDRISSLATKETYRTAPVVYFYTLMKAVLSVHFVAGETVPSVSKDKVFRNRTSLLYIGIICGQALSDKGINSDEKMGKIYLSSTLVVEYEFELGVKMIKFVSVTK